MWKDSGFRGQSLKVCRLSNPRAYDSLHFAPDSAAHIVQSPNETLSVRIPNKVIVLVFNDFWCAAVSDLKGHSTN
jgi:hypothetical protein